MPRMIEEDLIVPDLAQPFVDQAKGQLVGAAHVAQIVEMLVGTADRNQIGPPGTKAGTIVARV